MRMGIGYALGAAMAFGLSGPSAADEPLVVVELYTSQGCSSCPPADDLFGQLTRRADVLPLALHVDYWDYLGWADDFASPDYTARQKAYAHASGSRTIYTPQMVVAGRDHLVGNRPMELVELIDADRARAPLVRLSLSQSGRRIIVEAESLQRLSGPILVQLVRYRPEATVEIGRGENSGRTITYYNIVTDWRVIGEWSGEAPLRLSADLPEGLPAAVILQEEGPGAILAAARLR